MNDSMAQRENLLSPMELSGWKNALNWVSAILIGLLFLVSGIWKITDAPAAAVRMNQALVPQALSLPAALGFGIAETLAGVLILTPRYRRWGAWLTSLMLLAFMIYFAIFYSRLRGGECSCFPWVKRFVGPEFFIGDAIMLALAAMAGVWAKRSEGIKCAALILGAVSVFAAVSYGVAATQGVGELAPASIVVDGKPMSLGSGKTFVYFFDPECLHCVDAAKRMSRYNWGDTKVVAVAIQNPKWGADFLQTTGLKASLTTDLKVLRETFQFVSTPAGGAIEEGRVKATLTQFENEEPGQSLRKLGFIY